MILQRMGRHGPLFVRVVTGPGGAAPVVPFVAGNTNVWTFPSRGLVFVVPFRSSTWLILSSSTLASTLLMYLGETLTLTMNFANLTELRDEGGTLATQSIPAIAGLTITGAAVVGNTVTFVCTPVTSNTTYTVKCTCTITNGTQTFTVEGIGKLHVADSDPIPPYLQKFVADNRNFVFNASALPELAAGGVITSPVITIDNPGLTQGGALVGSVAGTITDRLSVGTDAKIYTLTATFNTTGGNVRKAWGRLSVAAATTLRQTLAQLSLEDRLVDADFVSMPEFLAGETITGQSVAVTPAGSTIGTAVSSGSRVQVLVTHPAAGTYSFSFTITTSGGDTIIGFGYQQSAQG